MRYTIVIQNLKLPVNVPDQTDTAYLDRVIDEFNQHLVTFNNGQPVELYETKEIRLLIFTILSFVFGMRKNEEADAKETKSAEAPKDRSNNAQEQEETLQTIRDLIKLCDRGLAQRP